MLTYLLIIVGTTTRTARSSATTTKEIWTIGLLLWQKASVCVLHAWIVEGEKWSKIDHSFLLFYRWVDGLLRFERNGNSQVEIAAAVEHNKRKAIVEMRRTILKIFNAYLFRIPFPVIPSLNDDACCCCAWLPLLLGVGTLLLELTE